MVRRKAGTENNIRELARCWKLLIRPTNDQYLMNNGTPVTM